jgi:hypothetical protein
MKGPNTILFLYLAVLSLLILNVNAISGFLDLPKLEGGKVHVGFNGYYDCQITEFAQSVSLAFDSWTHTEKLESISAHLWVQKEGVAPQNAVIFSKDNFIPGQDYDFTDLIVKSGIKFDKEDRFYFQGVAIYTAPEKPTDVSQYQLQITHKFPMGSSSVTFIVDSWPGSAEAKWIDNSKVSASARFYDRPLSGFQNSLSILLRGLPFSTKKLTFHSKDFLILSAKQNHEGVQTKCHINGVPVSLHYKLDRFELELSPNEPEYAVLSGNDINIICYDVNADVFQAGDKLTSLYVEFIDYQENRPAAVHVPFTFHALKPSFPWLEPDIVIATIPTAKTEGIVVCSTFMKLTHSGELIKELTDDVFTAFVQGLPTKPEKAYFSFSAGSKSSQNPADDRISLYQEEFVLNNDGDPIKSKLSFSESNWNQSDKEGSLLLTWTFIYKAEHVPPTQIYMPQCVIRYTDVHATPQVSITQIGMGAIGQPLTSNTLALPVNKLKEIEKGEYPRYSFDFDLLEVNGGFNKLVVELPQEDFFIGGKFTCTVTEVHYEDDDRSKKAIKNTVELIGADRHGKPFDRTKDLLSLRVVFSHQFHGSWDYHFKCPEAFLQRDLAHSSVKFKDTIVALYGFTDDDDELYSPPYYLLGSLNIQFDKAGHSKMFFAVVAFLILLAAGLLGLALYSRTRGAKVEDENYAFQPLTDGNSV